MTNKLSNWSELDVDEMYDISQRLPDAVFSFNAALWVHNLSDITPSIFDVTTSVLYDIPKNIPVRVHVADSSLHMLGVETTQTIFGSSIRVYNQEVCICQAISNKNLLERDTYLKAIRRYAKNNKAGNIEELRRIADFYGVREKVDDYMELLLTGDE